MSNSRPNRAKQKIKEDEDLKAIYENLLELDDSRYVPIPPKQTFRCKAKVRRNQSADL